MLVQSSERDGLAMRKEEALRRIANNLPDQDPSQDPNLSRKILEATKSSAHPRILERSKLVTFQKFSFERIKVSCAWTLKYRPPMLGSARIRRSREVAPWARPPSEFAPETGGTDCVFCKWRNGLSPRRSPKIGIFASEDRLRFILKNTPQSTTRPIAQARFRQLGHRRTDFFPDTVSARARHIETA